jgi:hypothetical protein
MSEGRLAGKVAIITGAAQGMWPRTPGGLQRKAPGSFSPISSVRQARPSR